MTGQGRPTATVEVRDMSVHRRRASAAILPLLSSCQLWTGPLDGHGYGWHGGRRTGAHRVAWEEANGPIPAGLFVLHRCDNPRCVRLEHLFLGTHADNMADMVAKGRSTRGRFVGAANPAVKHSAQAVAIARELHAEWRVGVRPLGRLLDVSSSTVRDWLSGANRAFGD